MSALDLVRAASEAGATLAVNGDKLSVTACRPLAPELIEELRRAKPEIVRLLADRSKIQQAGPVPVDPVCWRSRYAARTLHWECNGYRSRFDAQRIAFSELLDEFRKTRGRRWPAWQCAGCDEPIGGLSSLTLADGNRIHFDEENECLIRFGRRWRGDALAELAKLDIDPPPCFELL